MIRDIRDTVALKPPARLHETRDDFFQLGMSCTTGRSAPIDLVAAHMWFNVAATMGHKDAQRLRREIAAEMSTSEITTAQRAARAWITTH